MNLSFTFSYKFWTCELWWPSKYYINFIFSLFICFVIPQASRSPLEHKKRRKVPELIPLSLFCFYNLIVGGGGLELDISVGNTGANQLSYKALGFLPLFMSQFLIIYLFI